MSDGRHRLSRKQVEEGPHIRWNAFVDIISNDPTHFLPGPQRNAALVFLYESEVQNGGHSQYFSNSSGLFASETPLALQELGDHHRAKLLSEAIEVWASDPENDLSTFDNQFHQHEPDLTGVLGEHLDKNESLYIDWA